MKKYKDLTVNEKINLKQYAINLSGNKRAHLKSPDHFKKLNEIEINFCLSDYTTHNRKYQIVNGTIQNLTNRN